MRNPHSIDTDYGDTMSSLLRENIRATRLSDHRRLLEKFRVIFTSFKVTRFSLFLFLILFLYSVSQCSFETPFGSLHVCRIARECAPFVYFEIYRFAQEIRHSAP